MALQSKAPNRNRFWADLIVEELVRNGVTTFFASPGSRSTPLITAVYDHPKCHLTMHFDERGSAFLALGFGKATGKPAVWITTSGTAVANGLPAVIEADLEGTPMILLTADRPPELRDTDANQAIHQDHIFGRSVRWFFDLPAPTDAIDATFVLSTVDQAINRSISGPVHLNCMFREPLAPTEQAYSPIRTARFEQWESGKTPFTSYVTNRTAHENISDANGRMGSFLESVASSSTRVLLVLGRLSGDGKAISAAAEAISKRIGAVFTVDISSQARLGSDTHLGSNGHGIAHVDILLSSDEARGLRPDCIIQFGATPLSKQLLRLLSDAQAATYVVVDHRNRRIDPSHIVTDRIEADPVKLLMEWAGMEPTAASAPATGSAPRAGSEPQPVFDDVEAILNLPERKESRFQWQKAWSTLKLKTIPWLDQDVLSHGLTEQAVATVLSRLIPGDCALTLGSSNPVRHMDSFGRSDGAHVPILTNRGASGIDGTIASAIGFAAGFNRRPVVFLGDLALLYDLNSLALCKAAGAVIVVINNDGGGIFSYLPVHQTTHLFEPLFGTPHGFGFSAAATMFHLHYANPTSISALESGLVEAFSIQGGSIIEIVTDRDENLTEAGRLSAALRQRISSEGEIGTS